VSHVWKAHGLGNDYLVWEGDAPLDAVQVRALCDRHRGPGADGVLEPADPGPADHGVRIWNPDGSTAEKSGNGLRIFARWLADRGAGTHFSVWTQSDQVACVVSDETIRVAMGRFTTDPAQIPIAAAGPWIGRVVDPLGLPVVAVGVGNPHAVVWQEGPLDALPWRAWGADLEVHPLFPRRTNVQVARVLDRNTAELRVWERGAGETAASGSSACAVAAAGVITGRLDRGRIALHMRGGTLHVQVAADDALHLEGPVSPVGRTQLDPRWWATVR